jgi:hypothetical protein
MPDNKADDLSIIADMHSGIVQKVLGVDSDSGGWNGSKNPASVALQRCCCSVRRRSRARPSQAPFSRQDDQDITNDPGGTAGFAGQGRDTHLPNTSPATDIDIEFVEGGGGRRAANQVFQNAKPDGLTVGALSSAAIGLQVMKETGVMYDIDKFIYLGTPVSENHNVIYTRRELGLNSLDKLRAANGLRLGAQEVGAVAYISARLFAYFLDLKAPKLLPVALLQAGGLTQW